MVPIYKGQKSNPHQIYKGGSEIEKVYKGDDLVWKRPLGTLVLEVDTSFVTTTEARLYVPSVAVFYGEIDWGDGNTDTYTERPSGGYASHFYDVDGVYTVTFVGIATRLGHWWTDLSNIVCPPDNGIRALTKIKSWDSLLGMVNAKVCSAPNLSEVPDHLPTTVLSFYDAFLDGNAINDPNIGNWDVSRINQFYRCFWRCASFNVDISGWEFNKNVDLNFRDMLSVTPFNQDIGGWDTSSVTNMHSMLRNCSSFNRDLSGWCVEQIAEEPTNFMSGANQDWVNNPDWHPQWGEPCS